ncbi:DUF3168 domain-containing protein [Polymorphum gilvum]|uniref:Gene transfer agent-like protein n=1 Tax=Polymorphum gilvum (strain LMG 25793 / CGMCC 1.9160 / SL003B-26A1) TaxID=991905 RepID=F2IV19_POLGS|nr:DUF3168 domain-containing protein [Polymorphum gilvum]ADZ71350.1 Gene transfer agent-like protein [Polymorphum gilvum SL003B-26A1]
MSTTAAEIALRDAILIHLAGDAELEALLGPGRLFDAPPRGQAFPFLRLDAVTGRRLAGSAEDGLEHELRLTVLSRADSRDEAVKAIARVAALLDGPVLALAGHRLVDLVPVATASGPLRDGRTFRAELVLRAVTEPAD